MSQELRKALEIARSWMLYSHDGDADDYNEQTWNKYKEDCNIVVTALAAAPVDERGMREAIKNLALVEDECALHHDGTVCCLKEAGVARECEEILSAHPATPKEEAERAVIEVANKRLTRRGEYEKGKIGFGAGMQAGDDLDHAVIALAALSGKDGEQ